MMQVLRKASVAKCFGILAFTVLMLVIGCSSDLESQVEIIKEVPVEVVREVEVIKEVEIEKIVEKRNSGNLIIYSGRSEKLVGPIIEQFSDVSGINVQIKYGKTAALAAPLLEEGRNSPVYNGGNFSPVMDNPTHHFHKWVASSLI